MNLQSLKSEKKSFGNHNLGADLIQEAYNFKIDAFVGPCRVLDFSSELIEITKKSLEKKNIKKGERILAKTRNSEIRDEVAKICRFFFLLPI